jgi:hypothetical protein
MIRSLPLGAASESVSDDHADGDSVPPMSLSRNREGTYRVNGLALTETQAAERLQAKLHAGYRWRSNSVYANSVVKQSQKVRNIC